MYVENDKSMRDNCRIGKGVLQHVVSSEALPLWPLQAARGLSLQSEIHIPAAWFSATYNVPFAASALVLP